MKTILLTTTALLTLAPLSSAQLGNLSGGVMLGGGYFEGTESAYGFLQVRGTFYEDDRFAHTAFLEILGFNDSTTLEFTRPDGTTFTDGGDIEFLNITANYELEAKLFGPVSAYAGGGVGIEIVSVSDDFDFSLDSDTNFTAQLFAGLRVQLGTAFHLQAGARYLFFPESEVLNESFDSEERFGFEIGAGFQF